MAATSSVRAFVAIAYNEVLLNTRRVAPYVLIIVCSAAALMGWVRGGPAVPLGWARNSDFYISRSLKAFSFLLGPPLFSAVIMVDPVIRDFRLRIDPLIFSKPINRAQYLFGKFLGNFFVLVCCMAAYPLTLLVLQAFRRSGMVVQEAKVLPYFKHFFFFVVITHLTLAAIYFTVGTLTRNNKTVYLLAVSFYPIYVSLMLFLVSPLTIRWKIFFDAFLLSSGPSNNGFGNSAAFLNSYTMNYTPDMILNRLLLLLGAALCLLIAYLKFSTHEAAHAKEHFSKLKLSARVKFDRVRASAAIAYNEVMLNSRRVAPYVMALVCAGNGVLWWGWGPAMNHGFAVNSDAFIAGALPIYSFLTLPLFTAVIMGDPVIRDSRAEIDPLIFSKPISRAEYLLGKFFGSFFVLVCGQSAFVVVWFLLQAVPKQGLVTLPGITLIPYLRHFLVFVVISHLTLAAFYFTVGTMTRNVNIVYGLGVSFYPLLVVYNLILLNNLPPQWQSVLDPLLMRWDKFDHNANPALVNQHIVVYDATLIINRASMILIAVICLTILYIRFTTAERDSKPDKLSLLKLSTAVETVYYDSESLLVTRSEPSAPKGLRSVALPTVARADSGIGAIVNKLIGALGVELRLLRAERSLVVLVPLIVFLCILDLAFYPVVAEISYSAVYATGTAKALSLFLLGITVFYTGEAMHRDRELKIVPVLWSAPIPNSVLLLSKYLSTIALALSLIVVVGLLAIVVQLLRGHTPIDLSAYFITYSIVLVPSIVFITAAVLALNVVLRNKHSAFVVAIGIGAGLFYLYNTGYNHWLYNPLLYHLWKFGDLTTGRMLAYRLYWFALTFLCLGLAHVLFERKSK